MFIILEISFILLQLVLIAISVRALRKIAKRTMYSYKIISLIGGIIFFFVCFLSQFIGLITWPADIPFEAFHFVGFVIGAFTSFASINAFFVLPPFCLFLIISSIVLLKKEGKSLPNLLGILLFFALATGSAALIFSYDILDKVISVHSYAGYCFSLWFEDIFSIILSYYECLLFATMFVSFKARRHIPKFDKEYLIILGCRMRDDGKPASLLRSRIDRAITFAKMQKKSAQKELIFVPSGGQGADEPIAEAISARNYLIGKHIPKTSIIAEDKSKTTLENFRFSKAKIKTAEHVAFATSNYHVFRAGVIATKAGFKGIEGIGAKSPWYYYNSALIREFIANLNSEKRTHLYNIITIFVSTTIIIVVSYFCNLL